MSPRLRTALIALPVFLAALFYLPKIFWALFLAVWLVIGAWEWVGLAQSTKMMRIIYALVSGALCALVWVQVIVPAQVRIEIGLYAVALVFWVVVVPIWLAFGWRLHHPLALAVTGLIVLLPLWLALVQLQAMPQMLLMLMAILWISDTAAFLCGKRWGRRKLAPSISPGKTWEGVAGALVAVTLYYVLASRIFDFEHVALSGLAGLALFLGLTVLGVEGDLFESWIKRCAGVKDSGTILPGHGGILDRVDALTSSIPVAALVLIWFS